MNQSLQTPLWKQMLLLFLPIGVLFLLVILDMVGADVALLHNGAVYSFLGILFLFMLFGWQYYLGFSYLKTIPNGGKFFKINALIPVIFYGILGLVLIFEVGNLFIQNPESIREVGELRPGSRSGILYWVFTILLLHSGFTLFNNPGTIGNAISKNANGSELNELKRIYYKPMRVSTRITLFLVLGTMVLVFINDVGQLL